MNRFKRIVLENKKIAKDGFYINNYGEIIDINDYLYNMMYNTSTYFDIKEPTELANNIDNFKVSENIINLGTIDCILKLRADGVKGNVIALNFANATSPGGGYIRGATAQEESLCRASMLYNCLINQKDFYRYNKRNAPLYTNYIIYSHNIPIIRNDNGELLDNNELASFITSPAVNKKMAKFIFSKNKVNNIMKIRIQKIISLALSLNPEVIVLGAFGCGVCGNKKENVYPMFEETINKYVPLDKVKVIFAVRENIKI